MPGPTTHILLVEDEDAHAELMRLSFESRDDIRLTVASTLREANAHLATATPDLTIVDSLLPDGAGLELARDLCRRSGDPVILLTSHADEAQEVQALEAGVWRYLVKSESTLLDIPEIVDEALRERSRSASPRLESYDADQ